MFAFGSMVDGKLEHSFNGVAKLSQQQVSSKMKLFGTTSLQLKLSVVTLDATETDLHDEKQKRATDSIDHEVEI